MARSFYCPFCGKNTIHDEINYAEHSALRNAKTYLGSWELPPILDQGLAIGVDLAGMPSIAKLVCGFNGFWKCRECLKSNARKKDGSIDSTMNY